MKKLRKKERYESQAKQVAEKGRSTMRKKMIFSDVSRIRKQQI